MRHARTHKGNTWATRTSTTSAKEEATKWDPTFTEQIKNWVGPVIKRYFRAEVHGLDAIPPAGGALLVSNHSGGMFTPDVLVFAPAFYNKFGFDRPVYTLAHYGVFIGPLAEWLRRVGVIEASRENAAKALRSGALVLVFPGGDYDSYRSTMEENKIDFAGRTGYVRTAIETRCADRADGVDRCAGITAVPHPRRLDWRGGWVWSGLGRRSCRSLLGSRSGSA